MPVLVMETVALPAALTVMGDRVLVNPLPDNTALPLSIEALPLRVISLALKSPGSALNVKIMSVVVESAEPLAETS